MNRHDRMVDDLVDAAYDSGYYSGQKRDGEPEHREAIERRERARHKLLDELSILRVLSKEARQ